MAKLSPDALRRKRLQWEATYNGNKARRWATDGVQHAHMSPERQGALAYKYARKAARAALELIGREEGES